MAALDDGTIIPSFLKVTDTSQEVFGYENSVNDYSLRVGRILKAYSPSDTQNRNKKVIEYDVSVRHADGTSGYTDISYPRVRVASLFGGVADYLRWTPRIDNFDYVSQFGLGSKVLLLCINGNQRVAYIIGGIPHPDDGVSSLSFKESPYLEFEFNGIYVHIDKDGTFSLIHRGPTGPDGDILTDAGTNSSIQFSSEGNITLGYNLQNKPGGGVETNSDSLPFLGLLKQQNQIVSFAQDDISAETENRFLIKTTNGVKINDGGLFPQAFLRATIYRQQQEIMHNVIMPLLSTLSTLLTTSGATLTATGATLATVGGFHLIPVAGPLLASPLVIAAGATTTASGAALTAAGPVVAAIQAAIQAFEALSSQYLSNKHFHSEDPLL